MPFRNTEIQRREHDANVAASEARATLGRFHYSIMVIILDYSGMKTIKLSGNALDRLTSPIRVQRKDSDVTKCKILDLFSKFYPEGNQTTVAKIHMVNISVGYYGTGVRQDKRWKYI